jgi:hypothetical protein
LEVIGVQESPYLRSDTWYAWDVAKQLYYLDHPAESSPNYRLANPFTDERIRTEIKDRHLGWEIARASARGELPDDFWGRFSDAQADEIERILTSYSDRSSPPSYELTKLGSIVSSVTDGRVLV